MTTSGLRHVLLTVSDSHGFEYGVLRDFEDEIVRITGAARVAMPEWPGPSRINDRVAHGTRFAPLRSLLPRREVAPIEADVMWLVLMGPEGSSLDLLRAWDAHVGYRIVYVFDTFASQLPALRRLVSAGHWDLMITSFHGAVPMLERETGRPWHAVAQGVKPERFAPPAAEDRIIGVSSYGRRYEPVHREIDAFCVDAKLHYDISITAKVQRHVSVEYLYRQYAWHLRHSRFTVSWPVEVTHPERAGAQSPMTCRWFEAGASATPMIGRAPTDPIFQSLFGSDAVLPLDPWPSRPSETREALQTLWANRDRHLQAAKTLRDERLAQWTWEARVREILSLAKLPA